MEFALLDTDVVSYRFGRRAEFEAFRPHLAGKIPAVSFVTFGEAMKGAFLASWGEKRVRALEAHLRTYLILPADRQLAATYARLRSDNQQTGVSLSDENDWWVAATAIRYDIPLLTNDRAFRRVRGLRVLPPEP